MCASAILLIFMFFIIIILLIVRDQICPVLETQLLVEEQDVLKSWQPRDILLNSKYCRQGRVPFLGLLQ